MLVAEGDAAGDAYVLLSGRFGIYVRGAAARLQLVDTVQASGALLGEQALSSGRHFRSATVIALEPAAVAVLPGAVFGSTVAADPAADAAMQRQSVENAWRKWKALAAELVGAAAAGPALPRQLRNVVFLLEHWYELK